MRFRRGAPLGAPYKSFLLVIPSGLQPTRNLLFGLFQQPLQPCRHLALEERASAPEGPRTSSEHQSPSVAKATIMTAAYGTARAVSQLVYPRSSGRAALQRRVDAGSLL